MYVWVDAWMDGLYVCLYICTYVRVCLGLHYTYARINGWIDWFNIYVSTRICIDIRTYIHTFPAILPTTLALPLCLLLTVFRIRARRSTTAWRTWSWKKRIILGKSSTPKRLVWCVCLSVVGHAAPSYAGWCFSNQSPMTSSAMKSPYKHVVVYKWGCSYCTHVCVYVFMFGCMYDYGL